MMIIITTERAPFASVRSSVSVTMEVSGVVLGRPRCFAVSASSRDTAPRSTLRSPFLPPPPMRADFCDKAHLQYYYNCNTIKSLDNKEKKKKKKKKNNTSSSSVHGLTTKHKLELLKSFSDGFSMFSDFDPLHPQTLLSQVHSDQLSEAAEVFLKRLEQLMAEEKEQKRIRKQDKVNLKASRMIDGSSLLSSESSSSSSDSECGDVIHISHLRSKLPTPHQDDHDSEPPVVRATATLAPIPCSPAEEDVPESSLPATTRSSSMDGCGWVRAEEQVACAKRVEVCMGNKCRKSGGAALLAEFERQMGAADAASVVGCKCMGKCRSAPNVRVFNHETAADASVRLPTANPLLIGVGLEDVTSIVATLFGEDGNDFLQAALPASP